ncbi:MAG: alpha/beta fold hydrolase [Burkholderiaceae bacterium]
MSDLRSTGLLCEVHGSGTPVLMLHGLGGSSNTFEPLMPALGSYRTIRPDLPGAGRSALPTMQLSVDDILSTVLSVLEAAEVNKAHLVGHSFGTLLCQHLAMRQPERFLSLTLFGALTEPAQANRAGLRGRAEQVRKNGMTDTADAIVTGSLSAHTRRSNPIAMAFVRESLMRQTRDGYAANCEALAGARAVDATRLPCPVLVVTGREDAVTPVSMGQEITDKCSTGSLEVLEQCGHWTPIEKPAECASALQQFLPAVSTQRA